MKHLCHPIRAIREPFGTAGLIVACLALVLAMGGAAVAAKSGLTKSQEKQVKKIAQKEAKKYAGKNGAAGPAGLAGAVGPAGPAGKNGVDGTNGSNGSNGTSGSNGKSVAVTAIPAEEEGCEGRGGADVAQEGAAGIEVCNGKEGSPWTTGGTLPSGKTETGSWMIHSENHEVSAGAFEGVGVAPMSFTLPLSAEPTATYLKKGEASTTGCPGVTNGVPTAQPGHLCVYTAFETGHVKEEEVEPGQFLRFAILTNPTGSGPTAGLLPGASKAGSVLQITCTQTDLCAMNGTWAVTAE